MDFIKSLFKFLIYLFASAIAVAETTQYPYIEPIDIPQEAIASYRKLVDQSLFPNITDYLLYRAQYVAKFYIEGEDFLIPEYAVVINFLIKEYLNNVHPREGEDFSLERKVYSGLLQDIENFRNSAPNATESSIKSDHYPYNLKYSKVIDFLVRTSLIGSQAMEEPNEKALFENLILNNASLNLNHFYVHNYFDSYAFRKKDFENINLGINHSYKDLLYSSDTTQSLLKNLFKPTTWMLPNTQTDIPKKNNLFNLVFYFIQTTNSGLDLSEFQRIEGSHFIDIPSFSGLSRKSLWKYIAHDLDHLLEYMNHSLTSKIIRILNNNHKETLITEYLEKQAILQGCMWNSFERFFQDESFFISSKSGFNSFVDSFFDRQQEKRRNYSTFYSSSTSHRAILSFMGYFYNYYHKYFTDRDISFKEFESQVKVLFNKQLEKYPEYSNYRLSISKVP